MTLASAVYYAFVTGEVAPAFWGRSDLSKYDLGAATLENYIVDYRGGLLSRQGSEFCGFIERNRGYKLARFRGTLTDYLLVFTENKLRFVRNGNFVTQAAKPIVGDVLPSAGTITVTAHGYTNGDMIITRALTGRTELNNRQFLVQDATANTFRLGEVSGAAVNLSTYAALDGSETVERVYTVATPYAKEDLYRLDVKQRYNEMRLTHNRHLPRKLTFFAETNWVVGNAVPSAAVSAPVNLSGVASATGAAGTSFAVTSIDINGEESTISAYLVVNNIINYTSTLGSYTLKWDPVDNAVSYNIYRSLVLPDGTKVNKGSELAYIGSSIGNEFTDNNIVPDYTKTPLTQFNPFAANSPYHINVTAPGSGYAKTVEMSLTGGGSGFEGYPVVNSAGEIGGIRIARAGENYVSPSVTLSGAGGGTGATFEVLTKGISGQTFPAIFLVFQQRGLYFATKEEPASLWASRPGDFDNYDFSTVVTAADGYSFTIDSVAVEPIKHALAIRNGLLIFTDDGVVQLRAETGKAVSGVNALAEPQVYTGVSETPPIAVNLDVLFFTDNGASLQSLLYTEYTESFQMQDLSVLASHLLTEERQVMKMTHNPNPYKLIYMPRADGTMLTLTHVREQEVSGWARHNTFGNYRDTQNINENNATFVYQLVERFLNGFWQICVERIPERKDELAEDYWGVDCGISLPLTKPDAELYASNVTGDVTLIASANVFSADNVGDIVYYAGGKLEVTAYTNATTVDATYLREAKEYLKYGNEFIAQKADADRWCIATPQSVVGGLWHLEGQKVSVSYDGNAELDYTVENGQVALPVPSTKVYVGLPYECNGASLPLVVPNRLAEGSRNKLFSVVPRLASSRGMEFGYSIDSLEEMEDRTDEDWGEVINSRSDVATIRLDSSYDYSSQVFWRQRYPLPSALLGFVLNTDLGEL